MRRYFPLLAAPLALSPPAAAQVAPVPEGEETVYDGDWLALGLAAAYVPSYDGSDDYVVTLVPFVQGELRGIGINPRAGGFVLDFVSDPHEGVGLAFGPALRLRSGRATQIEDPVVEGLGKLDHALELGPSVGIAIPRVLHGYDSLSLSIDARWDVLGAHGGMVIEPSATYFTPLSRGAAVALTLTAEHGDGRFMDYYYTVTPADALVSGLSAFDADAGFSRASATLIGGVDLNGDLADGGLSLLLIGGYARMLGDAKASPFTSERGSADQWLGAVGLGYVF